jgi:membrane protein required for colicin V production
MNSFDATVYIVGGVAMITGFNAGLLRSIATIVAYLIAMPMAVAATSLIGPVLADRFSTPFGQNTFVLFISFLIIGIALAQVLRIAIDQTVGPTKSFEDRFAGAILGAVRIGLVAVMMVLIFERLIPPDRQPAFLTGSQLRPILSMAGQKGLKSLPPDIVAYIDQLKRDRRI